MKGDGAPESGAPSPHPIHVQGQQKEAGRMKTTTRRQESNLQESNLSESGFGLIEIVISMLLLGLLSVAFLPLLVTSMKTTVRNSTIATATQLVNKQMELARAAGSTCAALNIYEDESPLGTVTDARGVTYAPGRSVDCPASTYPGTVAVSVSVSVVGSSIPPISASTRILVTAP
ncbi:type IV pilus modification PilV family protein [Cryobacterium shii]|uniref:type IV pilus modification PilV family protein n=1 Tax=Cryobacterium shii TaxID=1259235 RepID=UPI00135B59D0|nr:type II secretion system protein [Cryobacterium shii]